MDGALDAILDAIKGLIERGELKSSLVDRSTIETVVRQLTKDENDLNQVGTKKGGKKKECAMTRKRKNGRTDKAMIGYHRFFSWPLSPLPPLTQFSCYRKQSLSGTRSACPR